MVKNINIIIKISLIVFTIVLVLFVIYMLFIKPPKLKQENTDNKVIKQNESIVLEFDRNISDSNVKDVTVKNDLFVPEYDINTKNNKLTITPINNDVFIPGQTYTVYLPVSDSLGINKENIVTTFTVSGSTLDLPQSIRDKFEIILQKYINGTISESELSPDTLKYFLDSTDEEEEYNATH